MTKAQWIKAGMNFSDIIVKSKKIDGLSVTLGWDCGEGNEGEFNEDDKQDEPLLRFDISMSISVGSEEEELQDSSFCTQLVAYADRKLLTKAAKIVLKEAESNCEVKKDGTFEYHWKRIMEGFSWMSIRNGKIV